MYGGNIKDTVGRVQRHPTWTSLCCRAARKSSRVPPLWMRAAANPSDSATSLVTALPVGRDAGSSQAGRKELRIASGSKRGGLIEELSSDIRSDMSSSDIPKERSRQRVQNPLEGWHMQNEVHSYETNLEIDEKGLLKDYDNGLSSSDGLKKDLSSVLLLLFLYILQGIPLGVAGSIPLILQSKNVSYSDQAIYSFVFWPFSLKLLWAPLVDAMYLPNFGRRKSWLVPTQYFLGCFMLFLSFEVDELLKSDEHTSPNVVKLTAAFFMFGFLAATQDVAVDGWALTMLSKENVGLASTCNSIGQTAGYFLGNVLFLALESAEFCNKYIRMESQPTGILSLADFLFFWGIVFLVSTTLVMVLKKENSGQTAMHQVAQQGIKETYKSLICIIRMPAILKFCILMLTSKIGFSAADEVTGLKLIEMGVPKEQLAILAVPMVPLQIMLPLAISKYTAGQKPLDVFYWAVPFRLAMGIVFALLVFWTPLVKVDTEFPVYYYGILLLSYALHQVAVYSMYVAIMAFNAKISDPSIGGTYMTLLNTISNLAGNWPATAALWLVDPLTVKKCVGVPEQSCRSAVDLELCVKSGGSCATITDGYYVESVFCIFFGLAWWLRYGKKFRNLQNEHPSMWRCKRNN